jgi:NADP-dependent 3-hydroxy acid dehydrogenase YdfG
MNDQRGEVWRGVGIITGASSGMGEAIARKLAPNAKGLVIAARRFDRIDALAKELGEHVLPVRCDVREETDVRRLAQTAIEHFGQIDVIINNAGIAPMASMLRCRVDDWENTIDTNIKGVLYGIAAVLPHMLERGTGGIINISSEAARRIFPGAGVYCASKHAVRALSEGLQIDLSARSVKDGNDIKVTTIAPGVVLTDLAQSVTYEPSKQELIRGMESVDGVMTAEDIADCIQYVLNAPNHVEIGEMIVRPVKQNM